MGPFQFWYLRMSPAQKERIATWIRWALALLLLPTLAMLDGRYVKSADYRMDRSLLLRIDSTSQSTAERVQRIYCDGKPAGCR